MVETVARAIATIDVRHEVQDAFWRDMPDESRWEIGHQSGKMNRAVVYTDYSTGGRGKDEYRAAALAALKAIREPTEGMVTAMNAANRDAKSCNGQELGFAGIFTAAIDAALTEEKG